MAEKKMTNIRLDPVLWARVKVGAGERGITLERWVTEALEAHLTRQHYPPRGAMAGEAGEAGEAVVPYTDGRLADAAIHHGTADGTLDGELHDLHWRVDALEAAVDYLAGAIGVGFPLSAMASGAAGHGARPATGVSVPNATGITATPVAGGALGRGGIRRPGGAVQASGAGGEDAVEVPAPVDPAPS